MLALTIYNKLTSNDITKGKKIVGTGTISIDGSVGEISGIEYKLKGAVHEKADLFIAPNGDNYKEAMRIKKQKHYDIKIIGVSTFDDAINYLKIMK
jgi:PDZ domain-containing protein